MADNPPRTYPRDVRGRFARVPVELAYAEDSKFDTMAKNGIDVQMTSGIPSPNTIEHARHAPAADTLAGDGPSYGSRPLRARRPELVHPADEVHTVYGTQGAVLRTAARNPGPMDPSASLVGLEAYGTPTNGVREVSDESCPWENSADSVRGDLRPASRGLGRGRDR